MKTPNFKGAYRTMVERTGSRGGALVDLHPLLDFAADACLARLAHTLSRSFTHPVYPARRFIVAAPADFPFRVNHFPDPAVE